MPGPKKTIVFSGMIAADPGQGGATWAVLQYLLGLRRLGHEVVFVEPIKAERILPPAAPLAESANATYFRSVMAEFHLEENAALLLAETKTTVGLSYDDLLRLTARADVLINVSGMLDDESLCSRIPVRLYLDLDPAFIQIWHSTYGIDMGFARHTHFATVGLSIGRDSCPIPTCGLAWIPTFQPIFLDEWPVAHHIEYPALTTIANWRGYGSVKHQGVHYGQKAHSLREFFPLPMLTIERFLLALSIHPGEVKDLESLEENRWELVDPAKVASTPSSYRNFIQHSKAEFGIAKSGYIRSRSGWFSDRSVAYLASGRPVLAHATGFNEWLPTGKGLFSFSNIDSALDAIRELNGNYDQHCAAARHIAEEYFESHRVLSRLLDAVE
jgi:hypothetical protein